LGIMLRTLLVLSLLVAGVSIHGPYAAMAASTTSAKKSEATKKATPSRGPSILIDAQTGHVLSQDRAGEPWYPASLSKLMTGYVVFQHLRAGRLHKDQQLTVSPLASSQEPSKIGVPAGKTVSVDFALQAMLVYSANDMAYVLAEGTSGSIAAFANEMNTAARQLGLSATHFVNPNGLFDPRQVTSARDMAVLAAVIIAEFPEHAKLFTQDYVEVGKRRLANRNVLIRTYPEADGMKTGFVCASGFNLVASASRNGRRLISVVLGMKNSAQRAKAARDLLEQGLAGSLPDTGLKVGEVLNLPQGAIVPVDMTPVVCRNKGPMPVIDEVELAGWAASFGTYDNLDKAVMALRGRVLSPVGLNTAGKTGILKIPGNAGYAPLIWNLSQSDSLNLCKGYREEGAQCEVLPQHLMEQMAAAAKAKQIEQQQPPTEQGSDPVLDSNPQDGPDQDAGDN
jgi:D-alanyl-D-alanine carboxypeptidase